MSTKMITLDLYKEQQKTATLTTRKGEQGQKLKVRVLENGQLPDMTGILVKIKGITPDHKYISINADSITNNIGVITLNQDWNSYEGVFETAYIEISKSGTIITTADINWKVLPNASSTGSDNAHYVDEMQKVIDKLQADADATILAINNKLADSNSNIDTLNARLNNLQQQLQRLENQLAQMDVYTKQESNALFVTLENLVSELPFSTIDQRGIVQLNDNPTIDNTFTAPTSRLVKLVRDNLATVTTRVTTAENQISVLNSSAVKTTGNQTISGTKNFNGTLQANGSEVATKAQYSATTWQTLVLRTAYEPKEGTLCEYRVITIEGRIQIEFRGTFGRKDGNAISGGGEIADVPSGLGSPQKITRTTGTNRSEVPCRIIFFAGGSLAMSVNATGANITFISLDGISYWID